MSDNLLDKVNTLEIQLAELIQTTETEGLQCYLKFSKTGYLRGIA